MLLASVGWKPGCQPFSCPWSENVTYCRKKICSTCLLRNPCLLWNLSLRSLPEAWGPWEQQYTPPVLHYGWIMPIPSLQLQKQTCLMQRSRRFGHAVVVSKICCNTVTVLSVVVWDCCKPTNNCRDWAFSNSGLEVGLPAFQLPMFAKCDTLPKGDLFTCLFKTSIPAVPFWNCNHPLPTRSRFLRATVRSTSSALWLHCSYRKKSVSCRGAEGLVTELWSRRSVTMHWLVLLCDCCKLSF